MIQKKMYEPPLSQNIDSSATSGYEISTIFPIINFWVCIILPSQVELITYFVMCHRLEHKGCGANFVVEICRRF